MKIKKKWLIIISFILLIIVGVIFIPKAIVKADDNIITYDDSIKVLEIEPGDLFALGDSNTVGPLSRNVNGKRVQIMHMTMTKFISMVDEINGQYDAVVIGRKNDRLSQSYCLGTPYRDYTSPKSQKIMDDRLPLSWASYSKEHEIDGIPMEEYCSENDITNKRAKQIIEMIKSNQLVYADQNIFDKSDTNYDSIKDTKLYKTFDKDNYSYPEDSEFTIEGNKVWKSKSNYKVGTLESITLENIVKDYDENSYKRPKVKQIVTPTSDRQSSGLLSNRNMNFKITMADEGSFKVKLYLDINADGLFKDKELVKAEQFQVNESNKDIDLNYRLSSDFVGYLDWKIEIVKDAEDSELKNETLLKTNLLGDCKLKALDNDSKKRINVLQITPNQGSNLINLSQHNKFIKLIQQEDVSDDYIITNSSMTINEANTAAKNNSLVLNGKYDMVILGFADGFGLYSGMNNYEDFSLELIEKLKDYIRTGQSVMFTHDTMAPTPAYNNFGQLTGAQELTRNFRDYIGQSRYPDVYRSNEIKNIAGKMDLSGGYKKIKNFDQSDLVKDKIIHDDYPDLSSYSLGTTLQGYINWNDLGWQGNGWINSQTIRQINKAQINQYPFKLNSNKNADYTINVADTHTQWYQLNLEDEDVVPWFNLKDNNRGNERFDSFDSRNNYYTYSKGNITYSGTGHSNGFTESELELFINTMIKAERGANHRPEVICSIPKDNSNGDVNEVPENFDYNFYIDASDLDNDVVYLTAKIDGQSLTESNIDISKLDSNNCFEVNTQDLNRSQLKITIPAEKIITNGSEVTVEVSAKDINGAESGVKTYKLRAVEMPKFNIEVSLDKSNMSKIDKNGNKNMSGVNGTTVKVNKDDIVYVPYIVKPQATFYGAAQESSRKEIVVIMDSAIDKNLRSRCVNGMVNSIKQNLINTTSDNNVRFDLIAYGTQGALEVEAKYNNYIESIQNIMLKFNEYPVEEKDNNSDAKLANAINMADNFFKKNNWSDSSKNIILISNRSVSDATVESISNLNNKNYNIITLDISEDYYDSIDYQISDEEHKKLLDKHKNLKKVHEILGGLSNDYFISRGDKWESKNVYNDIDIKNGIFEKIKNRIGFMKYKTFKLDNVTLSYNLGANIDLVGEGLEKKNSNSYDKIYIKKLPSVKYVVDIDDSGKVRTDSSGKIQYIGYFISDNANQNNITFTIKANENAKGRCCFNEPNQVSYQYSGYGIYGTDNICETPILQLDEVKIQHGLYRGIKNNTIIDENVHTFARGTKALMGAYVQGASNGDNINLTTLGNNTFIEVNGNPKVYVINSNNQLEEVGELKPFSGNCSYSGTVNGLNNEISSLLILYDVTLPQDSGTYKNNITVEDKNKDAAVIVGKIEQPDLF